MFFLAVYSFIAGAIYHEHLEHLNREGVHWCNRPIAMLSAITWPVWHVIVWLVLAVRWAWRMA